MSPLITSSDLSDILWTVFGLLYIVWVFASVRTGPKFVAAENLPKTNRAQPRRDAARAAHFDTAIASPHFKNDLPSVSHCLAAYPVSFRAIWGQFEVVHNGPTIASITAAGYRFDGVRVARDSAFWPARYLDRNKFTLNYLLRYGPGRSFNTSRPRPRPNRPPVLSCAKPPPSPSTKRMVHPTSLSAPILIF